MIFLRRRGNNFCPGSDGNSAGRRAYVLWRRFNDVDSDSCLVRDLVTNGATSPRTKSLFDPLVSYYPLPAFCQFICKLIPCRHFIGQSTNTNAPENEHFHSSPTVITGIYFADLSDAPPALNMFPQRRGRNPIIINIRVPKQFFLGEVS